MIGKRPADVETRKTIGHWEIDTVHGFGKHSVVNIVERKSGYVEIGKIKAATMDGTSRAILHLMDRNLPHYKTITADNGAELHAYKTIEAITDVPFYLQRFTTPGSEELTRTPMG